MKRRESILASSPGSQIFSMLNEKIGEPGDEAESILLFVAAVVRVVNLSFQVV